MISLTSTWTSSLFTDPYNFTAVLWTGIAEERIKMMVSTISCITIAILALFLHFSPCFSYISFVFGDSLVDAGNNDYLFSLAKADSSPYGIDFEASGGLPTGRFTNGRTIADIIGQALGGEKSFSPPYLSPNFSISDALSRGVNYASGASGILDETGTSFIGRVPLSRQISYFEQTRSYMVGLEGEGATHQFLKEAVFSIIIGSNDILNYLAPSIPFFAKEKLPPEMFQDVMVANLTSHLKRLHELGGRKFMVVGVGPLGCIPYVRALELVFEARCSSVANRLAQGYNVKLKKMLNHLNQELSPESVFVYGNSYDIFMDIIRNYQSYGTSWEWDLMMNRFENVNDPCCGGSFPPFICFKGPNASISSVVCEDRSKYIFWDAYHPTEATNMIVADRLLDGDARSTSPINMRGLDDYRP